MRDLPWPEELLFTVDQKLISEIGCAKDLYYAKVTFPAAALLASGLQLVPLQAAEQGWRCC